MNIDKIKNNIRAMLKLASNDAASDGEIRNAMNFATKLMADHNLTEEDVSEVDEVLLGLESAELGQRSVATGARMATWEKWAALFITKLVGTVKHYLGNDTRVNGIVQLDRYGSPKMTKQVVFYGVAEDAALAAELYDELVTTIAAMARLRFGKVYRGEGNDYCLGFANALWKKLDDAQGDRKATGTALVVAQDQVRDKKLVLADEYLTERGVTLSKGRKRRVTISSNDAYGQGFSDGSSHTVSADRRKKLGT